MADFSNVKVILTAERSGNAGALKGSTPPIMTISSICPTNLRLHLDDSLHLLL